MNSKDAKVFADALLTLNKTLATMASCLPHTAKEKTKKTTVSTLAKAVKPNRSFCKNRDYSPYGTVRVGVGGRPEVQPRCAERMAHLVNFLSTCPDRTADSYAINANMLDGTKRNHMGYTIMRAEKFGIVRYTRRGKGGYNTVSLAPEWRRNAQGKGIL